MVRHSPRWSDNPTYNGTKPAYNLCRFILKDVMQKRAKKKHCQGEFFDERNGETDWTTGEGTDWTTGQGTDWTMTGGTDWTTGWRDSLQNGKGKGLDNDMRGLIDWTTGGNHLQRPVAIHVQTVGKS
jgi:hypothetical protein